jgi:hypothetical protein
MIRTLRVSDASDISDMYVRMIPQAGFRYAIIDKPLELCLPRISRVIGHRFILDPSFSDDEAVNSSTWQQTH